MDTKERMDMFAAAALTGMLANGNIRFISPEEMTKQAYSWAKLMEQEREMVLPEEEKDCSTCAYHLAATGVCGDCGPTPFKNWKSKKVTTIREATPKSKPKPIAVPKVCFTCRWGNIPGVAKCLDCDDYYSGWEEKTDAA